MRAINQIGLLIFTCFAVALLIDFSHFHLLHNSDGLIPPVVSVLHWTPFFWRQNYYGMFWPLVFSPVHHVLTNFLLNNGAVLLTGVAAHFAVAYYVFRHRGAFVLGAVSLFSLLCMASQPYAYDNLGPALFFTTPYVFGIAALYLVEKQLTWLRVVSAIALMLIACWVNVSIPLSLSAIMLMPSAYWRQLPHYRSGARAWLGSAAFRQALLLGLGGACGYLWMQSSHFSGPSASLLPRSMWERAVMLTAEDGLRKVDSVAGIPLFPAFYAFFLVATLVVHALSSKYRRLLGPTVLRAIVLSCAIACFTCIHMWAANNAFAIRYWYPQLLVLQIALLGAVLLPAYDAFLSDSGRWRMHLVAAATLILAVVPSFGSVAWDNPSHDLETLAGPAAREAVEQHAQFISGNYWRVWAGVLAANMINQEQQGDGLVRGLSFRAAQELDAVPNFREQVSRVATAANDNEGARACRDYQLPPIVGMEQHGAAVTFYFDPLTCTP